MKRILFIIPVVICLQSCHSDQGGSVNDGKKIMIQDSATNNLQPVQNPDSSKMRDRVDIEKRDTSKKDSLGK